MKKLIGEKIILELKYLILGILKEHPNGLTNAEIGKIAGIDVEVPNHPGYISWTILQNLLEFDKKIKKEGSKYFYDENLI